MCEGVTWHPHLPPLLINTCPNELTMDRCGTPATAPDADLTDSADWKKAFTVSKSVKVYVIIVLTRFWSSQIKDSCYVSIPVNDKEQLGNWLFNAINV